MTDPKEYQIAVIFQRWYPLLLDIVDGVLEIRGVRRHCHFRNFVCDDFDKGVQLPEGYSPDGIITSFDNDSNDAEWLKELDVPVVNIFTCTRQDHASVEGDASSLVKLVVDHFASLNFDTIGVIGTVGLPQSATLVDTFQNECESRQIPFWSLEMPDGIMVGEHLDLNEIVPGLRENLQSSDGRTGVYAFHDERGRIVADYCLELGLKIPQQVGILGRFDSIDARLSTPELSSVIASGRKMGAKAIVLLIKLIEGEEPKNRHLKTKITEIRTRESTAGHDPTDMLVLQARSLIRDYACRGLTVDELVEQLPLSRSAFEKRYRALRGVTPAQEIRQLRVEKASQLLRQTRKKVDEIALEVGFTDARPFVVFFKREAGMTPGEFREEFKTDQHH